MNRIESSAAILVGGRSRRFQSDKAFMPFRNTTVARSLFERFSSVFAEVFFVADRIDKLAGYEAVTVADLQPGLGPLGGLQTALHHAGNVWCFIAACDLPFLDEQLPLILWQFAGDSDVVAPVWSNRVEPVAAFYHRRCLVEVNAALSEGRCSMRDFWSEMNVIKVDLTRHFAPTVIERMLCNVNTPLEYQQMLNMT